MPEIRVAKGEKNKYRKYNSLYLLIVDHFKGS